MEKLRTELEIYISLLRKFRRELEPVFTSLRKLRIKVEPFLFLGEKIQKPGITFSVFYRKIQNRT
jgi:hypothetical protein